MATMTMTLIGAYNYRNDLFDNLALPEDINRDTFIASLLMKSGEFELLYPDLDFLKEYIGIWSDKWYRTFSEWYRGTQASWNPIENYDRYEDASDAHSKKGTASNTATSTGNDTYSASTENKVSAYDAGTYQNKDKSESSSGTTTSNSTTSNGSDSETGSSTHTSHIHGNIGVTQASDMLRAFYDISSWNLYDHMSDVFIQEMLIPVY